jgi:hypothetical protein
LLLQHQGGGGGAEGVLFLLGVERLLGQGDGGLGGVDAGAVLLDANWALRTSMRTSFSTCCRRIWAWRYSSCERTLLAWARRLRMGMLRLRPMPLSGAVLLTN